MEKEFQSFGMEYFRAPNSRAVVHFPDNSSRINEGDKPIEQVEGIRQPNVKIQTYGKSDRENIPSRSISMWEKGNGEKE